MMKRNLAVRWRTGLLLAVLGAAALVAGPVDPRLYAGMSWRNIGPFRAGRVSAVTGVVGRPGTFYAGLPLGGIWKTTSAGETWYPVFDAVKEVSCIGALQAAPSDPNIIYAGTGDLITGGGINEGNGIYKSTDAGKTWTHLGLDDSKQIPAILVDPRDPRIVLLAAQGNVHTHSEVRGVFRSADGGQNWARTLYVDNETGAQALAWAYDQPGVVLATTVRHYTAPGGGPRGGAPAAAPGGAPAAAAPPSGTKLFKSLDQGLTWKEITGGGLPALAGRTSVAVAMNTKAQRMFIVGSFGLYRSDDGGANWRQMAASDRRIVGSGYLCGVYVDPRDPDIVYNLNTTSYRSLDGGGTFAAFKGAPGGDDPQQMWIDPTDGQRMFLGVDQGATISLDGGRTWSSWYNQPTGQIYHISTDNRYPYWVYGSQQDSGTVATRSRGDFGEITPLDWYPTPGYEFGSPVPDPLNPDIIYEGGPGNGIVKVNMPSGQWINVSPNVDAGLGLRKVTNQPMLFLPSNPRRLLAGFQYVMATSDGGQHWLKLSPDLTVPKGQPAAVPNTAPVAGARGGGAIESMSASTIAAGTIWAGTNNGLIQVTRDQGAKWEDVSIAGLPNGTRANISAIEASHHDPAEAYAAVDCHTVGDYKPYLFRTRDYGRTWTPIVDGLAVDEPSGSFARVIRADTKKAGLLFAGTESAVYVSFDDGDHWQSLMLNLPNTSYRDMTIHDADLVAATYGRGIWILDDISPLRQMTPALAGEPAFLFQPAPAIRVRRSVNGDTPFPPEVPHALNPPLGAIIDYLLAAKPAGTITLEILDAAGAVVRHLSSAPIPPLPDPPPAVPDYWLEKPRPMPVEAGLNRINWNLRYDAPPAFTHNYAQVMGAVPGDTPATPEGPLALPGVYTLKLGADGRTYTRKLTVTNDPRSPATAADLRAQHELQMRLYDGIRQAWDAYQQVAAMRQAVAAIPRAGLAADAAAAVTAFDAKLAALAGSPASGRRGPGGFGGPGGGTPPPPNFAGLNASLIRQLDTLDFGDLAPTEAMLKAGAAGAADLRTALNGWRSLNLKDLADFNVLLIKNNVKPIPAAVLEPAGGPGKKPRP